MQKVSGKSLGALLCGVLLAGATTSSGSGLDEGIVPSTNHVALNGDEAYIYMQLEALHEETRTLRRQIDQLRGELAAVREAVSKMPAQQPSNPPACGGATGPWH